MNGTKRVHSIARKLGNSWTQRSIAIILSLDVLLLILLGAGLAYYHEKNVLGSEWTPVLSRRIAWESPASIDSLEYRFRADDNEWHCIPMEPFLRAAIPPALILAVIELLMVLSEAQRAHRRARKLLKPFEQISREMEAFSRIQSDSVRYEDRLHDLEAAIESISPTLPDAKLRTGAQELTGLETAINNLLRRMHESYRQQAQFVSDASHELRTPIAVIQGYARMLERWGKDNPQVLDESIAAISSESDYMKKLVDELLFLARGEIGRNPFEPKPLSLTALIREVCDESAMIDPGHAWIFRSSPEIEITADAEMLKQCARVLCENARKYTPDGGQITLSVAGHGDQVSFTVQDEGVGIGSGDLPHVFDRFYRSDPARDRNSGGSGLGLAIAKWIVDRHGGSFNVLSCEGVGTRFTVYLPKT